ncbi:MAG: 2Fe-2S iron-sulfur cluster binding domain-containing protein [Granulosicoccus sp.]|nr:2Fe-2S iron-sulfur cluster binding domain-containing protein [Granulosicoccus sp.]
MFGFFSSKKNHSAQINSNTATLEIEAGDNLLNAALNAGLPWPHNCRVGSCGTCRCKLLEGKIKPLNDFSYVLDEDQLSDGFILACQTRLRSDVTVEVDLDESAKPVAQSETVEGVISEVTALTHDIVEIRISLNTAFPEYLAGQYADLTLDGVTDARSYSFARAPYLEEPSSLSFFVRHVPNGEMSSKLHDGSRIGSSVTVSGPHGSFYMRDSTTPAICVAGGSGLAPIKAALEQYAHEGFNRKIVFLFGARTQKDLYCVEDMEKIASHNEQFTFVPILSEEDQASDWTGERGLVTEFITQQGLDIAQSQAYLCGPPPMIDSAIEVLKTNGIDENQVYFDKFLDASHLPDGKR